MAIPNPFAKVETAAKKVPPKAWAVAIGGGAVLYFVYHAHSSNTAATASTDTTGSDAGSYQGSPAVDSSSLPGVYPTGAGQGYAGDTSPVILPGATDGVPGIDATTDAGAGDAVSTDGSGILTLNIVTSPPNPVTSAPGAPPKAKPVAPARGYHAGHNAGHDYYLPGVGYVSKAKYDAAMGIHPKAAGGMPKKGHPTAVHGAPKHSPKNASPRSHVTPAPASHVPAAAPEPAKRPRKRTTAAPKKAPVKKRLFANPNRPNNRKKVKH